MKNYFVFLSYLVFLKQSISLTRNRISLLTLLLFLKGIIHFLVTDCFIYLLCVLYVSSVLTAQNNGYSHKIPPNILSPKVIFSLRQIPYYHKLRCHKSQRYSNNYILKRNCFELKVLKEQAN